MLFVNQTKTKFNYMNLHYQKLNSRDLAKYLDNCLDTSFPVASSYIEDAIAHLIHQADEIDRLKKLLEK